MICQSYFLDKLSPALTQAYVHEQPAIAVRIPSPNARNAIYEWADL
jgi:hypothetical protein